MKATNQNRNFSWFLNNHQQHFTGVPYTPSLSQSFTGFSNNPKQSFTEFLKNSKKPFTGFSNNPKQLGTQLYNGPDDSKNE